MYVVIRLGFAYPKFVGTNFTEAANYVNQQYNPNEFELIEYENGELKKCYGRGRTN